MENQVRLNQSEDKKYTDTVAQICANIRNRRKNMGISQEDLARAIKTNRLTVNRIENSEQSPSIEQVYRIADALNCRVSDILPQTTISSILPTVVGAALTTTALIALGAAIAGAAGDSSENSQKNSIQENKDNTSR